MKNGRRKYGLTLIEILIAITVLTILVGIVIGIGSRVRTKAQEDLAKTTISLLGTALEQYYDFSHTFPPDVNYCGAGNTRDIQLAFDPSVTIVPTVKPPMGPDFTASDEFSSIEVLYYYLNRMPQSRSIIGKIESKLVTGKAEHLVSGVVQKIKSNDPNIIVTINGVDHNLFRVIDPWETALKYTRYRSNKNVETTNFPLIRSAGPDKIFNTDDDITSKEN